MQFLRRSKPSAPNAVILFRESYFQKLFANDCKKKNLLKTLCLGNFLIRKKRRDGLRFHHQFSRRKRRKKDNLYFPKKERINLKKDLFSKTDDFFKATMDEKNFRCFL